jgi:GGDEF domain-containing protein
LEPLPGVERAGTALSRVMANVDCFKRFNDRYGHQACGAG